MVVFVMTMMEYHGVKLNMEMTKKSLQELIYWFVILTIWLAIIKAKFIIMTR